MKRSEGEVGSALTDRTAKLQLAVSFLAPASAQKGNGSSLSLSLSHLVDDHEVREMEWNVVVV